MRVWFGAVLMLGATPALAADQFDLVCTAKNSTVRYRVDLAAGEYCAGDCSVINKIAAITSGIITLQDKEPDLTDRRRAYTRINRSTGEWETYDYDPRFPLSVFDRNGMCELAEFTSFPVRKF